MHSSFVRLIASLVVGFGIVACKEELPSNLSLRSANQSVSLKADTPAVLTLAGSVAEGLSLPGTVMAAAAKGTVSRTLLNFASTAAPVPSGSDAFTPTTNDGQVASNIATVALSEPSLVSSNVTAASSVNHAPIANPLNVAVTANMRVSFFLTGSDADGDRLTFKVLTTPAHGTLWGTPPELGFVPSPGFVGLDRFTFEVSDGVLKSEAAVVTIQISSPTTPPPANRAPLAASQTVVTAEDTARSITLTGSDPDGDAITFTVLTLPAHGTLGGSAPNLTYSPALNYHGADSFTFKTRDAALDSAPATVSITLTPVNDLPVAAGQAVSAANTTPVAITLAATDVDGDALTYFVVTPPAHGTLTGIAPALTYTANAGYGGPDVFTFKAHDGSADSLPATVAITVAGVGTALVEIMMPTNGSVEDYARPDLGAHYAGSLPVKPDSFRVYLDGRDFSAEAMIENGEVMFMPLFDVADGAHTYRIDWVNAGLVVATDSVSFTVNSTIVGTRFEGEVRDYNGAPLSGVVVTAATQHVTTASNGKFVFDHLPPGETAFRFETAGVPGPFKYAPVTLAFEIFANRRTRWARPVYLPIVDESKGVLVRSNWPATQVVTNPDIPGVKLTIPAHTVVTFPSGAPAAIVTLIDIPVFRSPNCLGPGVTPTRLYATQPENTVLSQPAELEFPNDFGAPEGARSALWNLNKQTGRYVETGVLEVKAGKVVSLPGTGLMTFDWHGDRGRPVDQKGSDANPVKSPNDLAKSACSYTAPRLGTLEEDHAIPAYQSLGSARSTVFHYSSLTAAPSIVASAQLNKREGTVSPAVVRFSMSSVLGGSSTFYSPPAIDFLLEDRFNGAARINAFLAKTGIYSITTRATSFYPAPMLPTGFAEFTSVATQDVTVVNGAELHPAMGSGWSVANVDRLVGEPSGRIIRVGGTGAVTNYSSLGLSANTATEDNLGFELGSPLGVIGYYGGEGLGVVEKLGFILPPEGTKMLLAEVDFNGIPPDFDELDATDTRRGNAARAKSSAGTPPVAAALPAAGPSVKSTNFDFELPVTVSPTGSRISFEADVLTDLLFVDTSVIFTARFLVPGSPPVELAPRHYGAIATLLPGGDTGYARRTGFTKYIIDLPSSLGGRPGSLKISLNSYFRVGTSGPYTGIRAAVLLDDFAIEGTFTGLPATFFTYAADSGDFTSLIFNPAVNQYTNTDKAGTKRIFDAQGREISSTDRWGNATHYTYVDGNGDGKSFELSSITDPVGLVTTLAYAGGKLSAVTDPAGRTTNFSYLGGKLVQITNPDGTTRGFGYDAEGKMTTQKDGKGQTRHYAYSVAGRLASVTRADGSIYEYIAAQEQGLPASGTSSFASVAAITRRRSAEVLTPVGQLTSTSLDRNGRPTEVKDALGRVTLTTYDSRHLPISVQSPNGNITTFDYDANGNVTRVFQPFNGASTHFNYALSFNLLARTADPLNRSTDYHYDAKGSLIKITDALNQSTLMAYNPRGQVTSVTDQRGKITTIAYDATGRKTSVTDPLGRTTGYSYTSAGNLASITDPLGHVTTMSYDGGNQITQLIAADGGITRFAYDGNKDVVKVTDPLGRETLREYDVRRRPTKTTDALGRVTTMAYDQVDNLVERVDPAGGHWATVFNAVNRQVSTRDPLNQETQYLYDAVDNVTRIVRPDGSAVNSSYDLLSRVISSTAADGVATTTFTYDIASQLKQMTDALGGVTGYTYDALGRVVSTSDPLNRVTTLTFDPTSNLTKIQRPDGSATLSEYDAAGQLTKGTAADGGIVTYAYNGAGNLMSLTDANGRTRTFGYDVLNRRASETDALGRVSSVQRDLAGNIVQQTRRDSAVITRAYDALNRLVQVNLPAVNGLTADTQMFTYDILGNPASATDNDSQVASLYDVLSRPVSTTQTFGGDAKMVAYGYDNLSRRVTMSDATGVTNYAYDLRDRLTQITDPASRPYTFAYDALSRPTTRLLPNGVASAMSYDVAGELLGITHAKAGATLDSVAYTYSNVGNRATEARADGNTRTFAYDPVDRVKSATSTLSTVGHETFAYDSEGNWTVGGRIHDAANQLTGDFLSSYAYDAQGNLVHQANLTVPLDPTTYTYDALDRLVRVVKSSSTTEYRYDALGRRIAKTVNGVTTRYVFDGDNARLELNASGALVAANHHAGLDNLLARDTSDGSRFLLADGLGSTTALTDSAGTVTERYRYTSFGQLAVLAPDYGPRTAAPQVAYTYTGRDWEAEAGLYFYRARFYSPTMGRFLSEDPLGLLAGRNHFTYVRNSPVLLVDPTGLEWDWWTNTKTFAKEFDGNQRRYSEQFFNGMGIGLVETAYVGLDVFNYSANIVYNGEIEDDRWRTVSQTFQEANRPTIVGGYLDVGTLLAEVDIATLGIASVAKGFKDLVEGRYDHAASNLAIGLMGLSVLKGPSAPGRGAVKLSPGKTSAWTRAEVNGARVYQRTDLIDPARVDALGRTNLERMQSGLAPIGTDGKSLNLHHMLQTADGPLAEMTQTFHQTNHRVIHINPSTTPSGINRPAFDAWRADYWITRANDFTR